MPQNDFAVTMTVKGLDDVLTHVKDPKTLGNPITLGISQSALAVQREAQLLVPVDSGRLRGDIKTQVERRSPFPTWARIGPNVFYGIYVELGTGLYGPRRRRIVPTSKKALAWTTKSGNKLARRSVRGMRSRPFMRPGVEAAQGRIVWIWQNVGRQIAGRIANGR